MRNISQSHRSIFSLAVAASLVILRRGVALARSDQIESLAERLFAAGQIG